MSFDHTVTEHEMESNARQFVEALRGDVGEREADLSVDGLSETFLSRILGLFGGRKN